MGGRLCFGTDDYYLDLRFYHLKRRCFGVIDLKMTEFTPEDAGKMNFYLSAVDSLLQHPSDAPSMGPLLGKTAGPRLDQRAVAAGLPSKRSNATSTLR